MKKLSVGLTGREYEICIGDSLLEGAGGIIKALGRKGKTVAVSDENVWRLWGGVLGKSLADEGIPLCTCIIPPGEDSKSLRGLQKLFGGFADAGLGRDGLIIALGGGVVGDLTGFAAATWMRGVPFVQIPTTLLAQVDSSVGGKTAVNLPQGKNLAGAFYQPRAVIADTGVLASLPEREFKSGLGEVVKYGAVFSGDFFQRLANPLRPDSGELPGVIRDCCAMKRDVVLRDELDTGERMLLNFGHSFGHAIEALGGFSRINHGEAVSMGMVLAAKAGEKLGITASGTAQELEGVLRIQGIDPECPFPPGELFDPMRTDKKGQGDGLKLVLLEEIGKAVTEYLSFEELQKLLGEI